ncbi:MAG: hypothetical protein KC503_12820, partial [Myxococcales bacterium]|nr:hypothetical protein [Myxococcales bacterium]
MFPPANIDRELAKRGRPGVWAYGVIAALVVFATPIYAQQPLLGASYVGGALLIGLARWLVVRRFDARYDADPRRWRLIYAVTTLAAAALFGGVSAVLLLRYRTSWTSLVVLLSCAGVQAGATVSLAPLRRLLLAYLALMDGP